VGYGGTFVTDAPATLVTLACGYADGYARALSNRAQVGFQGELFPLVGRVSMDVVVARLPLDAAVRAGDRMTLLSAEGADPHSVRATARLLDTITYEVTCDLSRRVRRAFV
jgi:alanine racemase